MLLHKAFFGKAIKHNGSPQKVTIDKSGSNSCTLSSLNKSLAKEKQIEIVIATDATEPQNLYNKNN